MTTKNGRESIHPIEAFIIILIIIVGISYSIISLEMVPHIPIVLSIFFLFFIGLAKGYSMKNIEEGMIDGLKSGLGAVMIFFFIGMLISSWMASGTIPTFIYVALTAMSGKMFYAITFVVTGLIGISIGSSLTTAATIGVAFMSVGAALDLNLAITAGAVISGAFFGDKMSPLSDTTILASMVVEVDLFEHIKNMGWTTIPAFILSFIFFAVISPSNINADLTNIESLKNTLLEMNLVHIYSIIPFILLAVLAIKKVSAIFTLSAGIISAILVSFFVQKEINLSGMMTMLFTGYAANSGVEEVDLLLTRGGIESMMFSISLVLVALSLGGLLLKLNIIPALLEGAGKFLHKTYQLITSAVFTAVGLNFLIGEQYLSILLTGNAFREKFKQAGLHPKNLSRALEDGGTVINPLVPWSVCGIFLTSVLGVSTISYFPYVFFCLLCPVLSILFGITGITIKKTA